MTLKTALYSHLKGSHGTAFTADDGTDVITATEHGRSDGDKVRLATTDTLPAGLAVNTDYYVRDSDTNTFKLAATPGAAAIDITDTGTGTHSLVTAVTDQGGTRIYATRAPQSPVKPYLVYRMISAIRFPHIGGPSGLARARIQFDIFAGDPDTVDDIVEALRFWLDGLDRSVGSESLQVRNCTMEDINDDLTNMQDGSDITLHETSVDFLITYKETAPIH